MLLIVIFANMVAVLIAVALVAKSSPILAEQPVLKLLTSVEWHPSSGEFGFLPYIIGTVEVTLLTMVFAVPVCLLCAVYLSEYANRRLRTAVQLVIDLMAGIPSVVFGLFGIVMIVPFVHALGQAFGVAATGYSLLAGGVVLAVMVFPIIISVLLEIFQTVPKEMREASLALGATKWETVKHVVIRAVPNGIIAAVALGFARAFGETIAVMMVVGNVARIPSSVFDAVYPLPALIANNYGEMMSVPLYDSALMFAALILMLVVGGFSLATRLMLWNFEKRWE